MTATNLTVIITLFGYEPMYIMQASAFGMMVSVCFDRNNYSC